MSKASITTANGNTWQEVAADRQRYRQSTLAAVEPNLPSLPETLPRDVSRMPKTVLTKGELAITEMLVEDLVPKLAKGELTATEVVKAFLRRAALAQTLTNCVTELMPAKAIERANQLDKYLAEHGNPVGPLHGVPISVKEHIGMKGLNLDAGFISWVGTVGSEDAHILQILWRAGAVFYARTTQPQTLMHLETSSNIYGVTVNPFNTLLTSGGSSGGEGALVGMRGSVLGIGSDIGGSIRSPAANNGVYGLRPTSCRLPLGGASATMMGQEQIVPTFGPLSTSLEGLSLFMKTVVDGKPWLTEPSCLPFAWTPYLGWKEKKLKVGVLWDDGVVKPHPPVLRALKEVVEKLKARGNVEVVEWKPYKHDLAWEIIANLYFADGATEEKAAIDASGEPWRPLSNFIITENPHLQAHSVQSLWEATLRRETYKAEYAAVWNATAGVNGTGAVDVILSPVGPGAAPLLDNARYWGYTAQWNLLDYPAAVFPVTKVMDTDVKEFGYTTRNEQDKFNYELYDAEKYVGAPVGLQLVARRYEDEKLLAALEVLKREAGFPYVDFI